MPDPRAAAIQKVIDEGRELLLRVPEPVVHCHPDDEMLVSEATWPYPSPPTILVDGMCEVGVPYVWTAVPIVAFQCEPPDAASIKVTDQALDLDGDG